VRTTLLSWSSASSNFLTSVPFKEPNRQADEKLQTKKHLAIVKGATHLFEEPGTLQKVAPLAAAWFKRHIGS
jgi:hypothetical protein